MVGWVGYLALLALLIGGTRRVESRLQNVTALDMVMWCRGRLHGTCTHHLNGTPCNRLPHQDGRHHGRAGRGGWSVEW